MKKFHKWLLKHQAKMLGASAAVLGYAHTHPESLQAFHVPHFGMVMGGIGLTVAGLDFFNNRGSV